MTEKSSDIVYYDNIAYEIPREFDDDMPPRATDKAAVLHDLLHDIYTYADSLWLMVDSGEPVVDETEADILPQGLNNMLECDIELAKKILTTLKSTYEVV